MVNKKVIKLRTEFNFDSAHRLVGYDGLCSNLHGHIWNVEVEVGGSIFDLDDVGILWDFTSGKKIKKIFDHKTILKNCPENKKLIETLKEICGPDSVFVMHDNPTAEHLALLIVQMLKIERKELDFKVKVYESPKSYAEVKL